jgi:hypothetical protein
VLGTWACNGVHRDWLTLDGPEVEYGDESITLMFKHSILQLDFLCRFNCSVVAHYSVRPQSRIPFARVSQPASSYSILQQPFAVLSSRRHSYIKSSYRPPALVYPAASQSILVVTRTQAFISWRS